MLNRKMKRPSHIRLGEVSAFKKTHFCFVLLVAFLNISILAPFSYSLQAMELRAESVSLPSGLSTEQAAGDGLASSQLLVAQLVHVVHALPQAVQQIGSRTQVQVPTGDSESLAPKMKGMPISHFQNEDASFWASSVKRVQPSSLRVYRI